MKNNYFSLLPALLSLIFLFSERDFSQKITAAEASKPQPASLKSYDLFTLNKNIATRSTEVANATYLDINPQQLRDLFQERPFSLQLSIPTESGNLVLDLHENEVLTHDFIARAEGIKGTEAVAFKPGAYYTGHVLGDPKSIVTFSIFENWVMGIFSYGGATYNLGPTDEQTRSANSPYIFFKDKDMLRPPSFDCYTEDKGFEVKVKTEPDPNPTAERRATVVRVYIEADYRMYTDRGRNTQEVINYVTGLFNELTTLYANEQILTRISEIKVWTTQDPYPSNSSHAALDAFTNRLNGTFNGDLAHLFSTIPAGNGGVAWLDVLCVRSRACAYSNISNSFNTVPTYSWSVEVITHEMGHNLGSRHTHACAWGPGRNQALDNCYTTEGGCSPGPAPTNGGTIMSYCHLTSNGINFQNGFGSEPGNLIRTKVSDAPCLEDIFDCFSKKQLQAGITYSGNTGTGGARGFETYPCVPGAHRGNEIAHAFVAPASGLAYLTYKETAPERIDLMMMSSCDPANCIRGWQGSTLVVDSFNVVQGTEYVFVTDVLEDSPGGNYDITISLPNAGCVTTVTLSDGVPYSGNTSTAASNLTKYNCASNFQRGKEVGHYFVSPTGGNATVIFNESTPTASMNVMVATACNPDSCIQFWSGPSINRQIMLQAGKGYYFIVDSDEPGSGGAYSLTVSLAFSGSNCTALVALVEGTTYNGNTNTGSGVFANYACTNQAQLGKEVGHFFISPVAGLATVEFTENNANARMNLMVGSACNPDSCIQFWSGPDINRKIQVEANKPYYFIVDAEEFNAAGPYQLTVTIPQVNNCFCTDYTAEELCENFDSYENGPLTSQAPCWLTPNGDPAQEGIVTDAIAASGEYSLRINSSGQTGTYRNLDMQLGNRTTGKYILKFKLNPATLKDAHFRVYHTYTPGSPDNQVAFDVKMEVTQGVPFAKLYAGNPNGSSAGFTFVGGGVIWTDMVMEIDLDRDSAKLFYIGAQQYAWKFSNTRNGSGGIKNLAAINFYADDEKSDFNIDDVRLYRNDKFFCEESGAIFCDDFDTYQRGGLSQISPDLWTPSRGGFGPEDVSVTAENSYSGINSIVVLSTVPGQLFDNVHAKMGTYTSGRFKMQFKMYVPLAKEATFRILHDYVIDTITTNEEYSSLVKFNLNGTGTLTGGGQGFNFKYPQDQWFDVSHLIDLTQDQAVLFIDGRAVGNWTFSKNLDGSAGKKQLRGVNFYAPSDNSLIRYFIDNVELFFMDFYLTVRPNSISLPANAGSATFDIATNAILGWQVTEDIPWLTATPGSGLAGATITVNHQANTSIESRHSSVRIGGPGLSPKYVDVIQAGANPALSVSPGDQNVDYRPGSLTFNVSSNVLWNVISTDTTWLKPRPGSGGRNNGTFTVDYTENFGGVRSDTLILSGQPAADKFIIITQGVQGPVLRLESDTLRLPSTMGDTTFKILTNVSWTLNENAGWFAASPTSGNGLTAINLSYDENPRPDRRQANITITGGMGTGIKTLVVVQEPSLPFMDVSTQTINLPVTQGSVNFALDANVDWTLTKAANWYTLSRSSGSGDAAIVLTHDENPTIFVRRDTILAAGNYGVPVKRIIVEQAAAAPKLQVSQTTLTLPPTTGDTAVDITTNLNWNMSTVSLWMYPAPTNGAGNARLNIRYDENTTLDPRTDDIVIAAGGIAPNVVIRVTQLANAPFLDVDPDTIHVGTNAGMVNFDIAANVDWNITDDAGWFSTDRTQGSGRVTVGISYLANASPQGRAGTVTVTGSNGVPVRTVVVIQAGLGTVLTATPDTLRVPNTAGNVTVNVASNILWSVSKTTTWITLNPINGFGNGTTRVSYQANPLGSERIGYVILSGLGAPNDTVVVIQDASPASLDVNPTTINVQASAGTTNFDISGNVIWTTSVDVSWLSVNPSSGTGAVNVVINYQQNPTTQPRTGTITITGGNLTRTVTVVQAGGQPALSVDQTTINVGSPAGTTTFNITANIDWTGTVSQTWARLVSASGSGSRTVTIEYDENPATQSRMATITIQGVGTGLSRSISLIQGAAGAVLTVDPTTINVSASAGTSNVTITGNVGWTASDDAPWLSVAPISGTGNGNLTATYTENTTPQVRTATITMTGAGVNPLTITVTQAGAGAVLSVDRSAVSVAAPAGSASVNVTSNTNWSVSENVAWFSVSPASGTGSRALTINYDENLSTQSRNGTFTVSASGLPDITVTVTQAGAAAFLTLSQTTFNVAAPAGSANVTVTANVNWTLNENSTWINVAPASGSSNGSFTISYDENLTTQSRSATITVSGNGIANQTITVTQAGATAILTVDPTSLSLPSTAGNGSVNVTSNTTWTVTDDATWLNIAPTSGSGNGTLNITFDANATLANRTATITISGNGTPNRTISVTQAGIQAVLTVTPTTLNVSAQSGVTNFQIDANIDWTIRSQATWFTLSTTQGSGPANVRINYQENTGTQSRSATITISSNNLLPDRIVTINQAGAQSVLTVTPTSLSLAAAAGSTTVNVSANVAWTATDNATWLSVTPASGTGNANLMVNYDANTGASPRTATITISSPGLPDQVVNVMQQGTVTAFLTVNPGNQSVSSSSGNLTFTVSSNVSWTISSNSGWASVLPASGSGNGFFVVNWSANINTSPRVATITITATGLPAQTITITQAAFQPQLSAGQLVYDVGPNAGSLNIQVLSNTSWSANVDVPWVTVTPVFGSNNLLITASYLTNPGAARTAKVTLSAGGVSPVVVTINQSRNTATADLEKKYRLVLSPNPTSDQLYVQFELPAAGSARLDVLTIDGKILSNLIDKSLSAGPQVVTYDVRTLPAGLYLLRFRVEDGVMVRRFAVNR